MSRLSLLRLVLAPPLLALGLLMVPAVFAQKDEEPRFTLRFSYDRNATAPGDITLRPNVAQEVFVFVESKSDDDEEVTVQMRVGDKAELKAEKLKVPAGKTVLVSFAAAPGGPPPAPKDAVGPIGFVVLDATGKALSNPRARQMKVGRPDLFITKDSGEAFAPTETESAGLSVVLKATDMFAGPAARLVLEVPPERQVGPKKGRYSGFLSRESKTTLKAQNLNPTSSEDLRDYVYVTVDGYKRGLVFRATFPAAGSSALALEQITTATLGLNLPKYSRPTDKLPVTLFADGNIGERDRIDVSVLSGKTKKGDKEVKEYTPVAHFIGPRQTKMKYSPGPGGGVVFDVQATDHTGTLDMSGVFEKTEVMLELRPLDREEKGVPIYKKDPVAATVQEVLFDDTPPAVSFVEATTTAATRTATKVERGRTLRVFVQAASVTPITDVRFFLGKLTAEGKLPGDGKLPPDAVKGKEVELELEIKDKEKPRKVRGWATEYLIPADAKGPIEVTAWATNAVGLSGGATATFEVIDPKDQLSGRVFELDVPIDNLPVLLLDVNGKELKMTRTADGGKYAFTDLEPGVYFVYARRAQTASKAMYRLVVKDREVISNRDLILQLPPVVVKAKEKKEDKKAKKAKIVGQVTEGDRVQAGVPVRLIDTAGRVKTTTTNDDGAFEFTELEKGRYAVVARKSASRTAGRQVVDVGEGEEKLGVAIKLFR